MKATEQMINAACEKAPSLQREDINSIVQAALDAGNGSAGGQVEQDRLQQSGCDSAPPSGGGGIGAMVFSIVLIPVLMALAFTMHYLEG